MSKSPDAFRTISEVADWLETPAHVLRFWESKFAQVKPVKRAGGRRYYRPADMELLGGIKKLLHEDGMTIKGVQKILREQGVRHVSAMSLHKADGSELVEDAPYVEVETLDEEPIAIADARAGVRQTALPFDPVDTPPDETPEPEDISPLPVAENPMKPAEPQGMEDPAPEQAFEPEPEVAPEPLRADEPEIEPERQSSEEPETEPDRPEEPEPVVEPEPEPLEAAPEPMAPDPEPLPGPILVDEPQIDSIPMRSGLLHRLADRTDLPSDQQKALAAHLPALRALAERLSS